MPTQPKAQVTRFETEVGDPERTRAQDVILKQGGFVFMERKVLGSYSLDYEAANTILTETALLIESTRRVVKRVFLHIPLKRIVSMKVVKNDYHLFGPLTCVKVFWRGDSGQSYWFMFEPYQLNWLVLPDIITDLFRSEEPPRKWMDAIQRQLDKLRTRK